jgi:hypothetical protein
MPAKPVASASIEDSRTLDPSKRPVLHIVCDRDVGLFNLALGVISHTYWALNEERIPIIYYHKNNCYWTPNGYHGRDSVWEYYFEPVIPEYPVSQIPPNILKAISDDPPQGTDPGRFIDEFAFVSNDGAWGVTVDGEGLRGPATDRPSSRKIREIASAIIRDRIRPRDYIVEKANRFFEEHLAGRYVIGVHIRGTDAIVDRTRHIQQSGVYYQKYAAVLRRLLRKNPGALIFVASDEQASVDQIRSSFSGVIAYDSIRHVGGEVAGSGPAGGIMPAYLTQDPDRAAQNGEEAVIEYMLLCRCNYLVHNYSSIPRMVLLTVPGMPETNVDESSLLRQVGAVLRRRLPVWRAKTDDASNFTRLSDLPPLPKLSGAAIRWNLIEGLNVQVLQGTAIVPGQRILRLVAAGENRRHALGVQFGPLDRGRIYRASAWVKAAVGARVMIEAGDIVDLDTKNSLNAGVAQFDLASRSVINCNGDILASGVDVAADGWKKVWVDLRNRHRRIFASIGLLEAPDNYDIFAAAGQSMVLGGFEISPLHA